MRPTMRGLTAFDVVMRTGSFAAAADELNLTPSAVSYRIKSLEDALGVQLFNRIHRQSTPTDAAIEYHRHIGYAFEYIERSTLDLMAIGRQNILFVHSAPTFATQWLMPRLSSFFIENPGLDVRVTATPQSADPERDNIDVDIRYGRRYGPGMLAEPLCEETVTPMASPKLLADTKIRTPEDLAEQTLINSLKCLVRWPQWLSEYAPELPPDIACGPQFDRSFLSIGTARDGLGVCLESTLLASPELESGTLVPPFGRLGPSIQGHFLAVPRQKMSLDKILLFRRWLRKELQRAGDWITPLLSEEPHTS